jgi:hypothetical protein
MKTIIKVTAFIFILSLAYFSYARIERFSKIQINTDKSKIRERINPPTGYKRKLYPEGSYQYFLQNLPLKPHGAKVLDYKGEPIYNQFEHIAVIDYDIGNKDLQQCADAVIRLRAEYLYAAGRKDDVKFHYTSGHLFSWNQYARGYRSKVNGNKVEFIQTAAACDSYDCFRKYLDNIFMYAGTISINAESQKISKIDDVKPGDFIVTPGSPGHVVLVVDEAVNAQGQRIFLLAQGYTPAQSIHVLKNPFQSDINPWYTLKTQGHLPTARYNFYDANVRRFKE